MEPPRHTLRLLPNDHNRRLYQCLNNLLTARCQLFQHGCRLFRENYLKHPAYSYRLWTLLDGYRRVHLRLLFQENSAVPGMLSWCIILTLLPIYSTKRLGLELCTNMHPNMSRYDLGSPTNNGLRQTRVERQGLCLLEPGQPAR